MKKNILILAPNSFPMNGPEGIVNAKLVSSLVSSGYVVDVVSKYNKNTYMPTELDSQFSVGIRNLVQIDVDNKITFKSVIDHLKVFLKTGYVYKGAHWAYYAIKASTKLIRKAKYDYILSRNPPSELAALYLSKKYNIPWIANWNDPYPEIKMPVPYGLGVNAKLPYLERRLLANVSKTADFHSFPTMRQRDYMMQYMGVPLEKTVVIPHVCFENLVEISEIKDTNALKIIHSGNVSFPRNPNIFIQGVKEFLLENPDANLEINFIGNQSPGFSDLIDSELVDIISILAPLPYLDNLKLIAQHHVALIIEAPSENSVFLPTKVGDYMQCGVEIFAVSPINGVLHDLFLQQKIEYFASCEGVEEVKRQLCTMYTSFKERRGVNMYTGILEEYSCKEILKIYDKLLS